MTMCNFVCINAWRKWNKIKMKILIFFQLLVFFPMQARFILFNSDHEKCMEMDTNICPLKKNSFFWILFNSSTWQWCYHAIPFTCITRTQYAQVEATTLPISMHGNRKADEYKLSVAFSSESDCKGNLLFACSKGVLCQVWCIWSELRAFEQNELKQLFWNRRKQANSDACSLYKNCTKFILHHPLSIDFGSLCQSLSASASASLHLKSKRFWSSITFQRQLVRPCWHQSACALLAMLVPSTSSPATRFAVSKLNGNQRQKVFEQPASGAQKNSHRAF